MQKHKKILISLPEVLLNEVDVFVESENTNRSEFVREAIKSYLKEKKRQRTEEQMKKGYLQMGKINSEYAEDCLFADETQLKEYEEKLAECE